MEHGTDELRPEPILCGKVLEDILVSVRPLMENRRIDFQVDARGVTAAAVLADPMALRKILLNLLSNAIKFTPEGGQITLTAACDGQQGDVAHGFIRVQDTGVGISKKFQEKMFEPFAQERTAETAGIGGSVAAMCALWLFFVGFYLVSNAVRRDEDVLDNLHSVYVDQWDWEKVILPENRNIDYLKSTVMDIVRAVCDTQDTMQSIYPQLQKLPKLNRNVSFITAQELEDAWPELTPKEREHEYLKNHKTAFIIGIGGALKSGKPHDGRAPDYDDWDLNGDILFWDDLLECAFELSSMGIRVDPRSLDRQLTISGCDDRRDLPYHKMLLNGELPLTIGGGIGQSRLSMLLLGKCHIGEVQVSIWDGETMKKCEEAGVMLL